MEKLNIFDSVLNERLERRAYEMLEEIAYNMIGDIEVIDGWYLETHTIGCRNHSCPTRRSDEEYWEEHWKIFDEMNCGNTRILGDPADGKFVTIQAGQEVNPETWSVYAGL